MFYLFLGFTRCNKRRVYSGHGHFKDIVINEYCSGATTSTRNSHRTGRTRSDSGGNTEWAGAGSAFGGILINVHESDHCPYL